MRWQLGSAALVIILGSNAFAAVLRPDVIYGSDDRQDYYQADANWKLKADATVALIRTSSLEQQGATTLIKTQPYGKTMLLCPTEPYFDQEIAAVCSGFLVTPDTIVTAGHCIPSQKECDAMNFIFGFRLDAAGDQPRSVPTDHVFRCQQLVYSVITPAGEDFAVAKVDRSVTFATPLTLRRHGSAGAGENMRVIGHPGGLPVKVAGGAAVRAVNGDFLVASLDTYGGNSGSAVFNESTGEVEGILVRGEEDFIFQNGCRVSKRCDVAACRGEEVTLIERVLNHL